MVKPLPQVGTVKGTVSYGGDVSGVTMTLEQGGLVVASVLSDSTGGFQFLDTVAIGEYDLKAHKDVPEGFLTGQVYITVVGGDNAVSDLPLVRVCIKWQI